MKCKFCGDDMIPLFNFFICPNNCEKKFKNKEVLLTYDGNGGYFYLGETCPICGTNNKNISIPGYTKSEEPIINGIYNCRCNICSAEWKIEFINYKD